MEKILVVRQPSKGNKIKAVFAPELREFAVEIEWLFGLALTEEDPETWTPAQREYWLPQVCDSLEQIEGGQE